MPESNNVISVIQRSATEQLQIAVNEFKGKKYLDLRIFYTTDEGTTWSPTKKGVTVAPDQLFILQDAITAAIAELGVTPKE